MMGDPDMPASSFWADIAKICDGTPRACACPGSSTSAIRLFSPGQNDALKQQLAQLDAARQPNLADAGAVFASTIVIACP
jgi:hypothetical protein